MASLVIPFIIGALLATLLTWLALQQLVQSLKNRLATLEAENSRLGRDFTLMLERATRAESESRLMKEQNENLGTRFKHEFSSLAQSILDEKTKKFTEVNEEKMKGILEPFRNQITDFRKKVEETYDKESKERFSLAKEVDRLVQMTQVVSQEANNLTSALKGDKKMQGNWGEMILEGMLENSGLAKNREYFLQEFIRDDSGQVVKDDDGKGLQPDATICYPDARKVVVDSKVSLIAWERYINAEDDAERKSFLLEHVRCIRHHIDSLSKKNYPRYAKALDYVLMFIPIEPAFLEAVKTDTQLWQYAYNKKILLVSPTNLFAVLKIVADLWKVEKQNKNALEIARKAGAMYDKFVNFLGNFTDVGEKLSAAQNTYDDALKQLATGKGNLAGRMQELKDMGASTSKQIPEQVLMLEQ